MFAHPLTFFWTHLEASNCHIEKEEEEEEEEEEVVWVPQITPHPILFRIFCLGSIAGVMEQL